MKKKEMSSLKQLCIEAPPYLVKQYIVLLTNALESDRKYLCLTHTTYN